MANAAEYATSVNTGAFCLIMIIALQYSLFHMKLNFRSHWKQNECSTRCRPLQETEEFFYMNAYMSGSLFHIHCNT